MASDEASSDPSYLLRGLEFPAVDEETTSLRRSATALISAQVAFLARCGIDGAPASPPPPRGHSAPPLIGVVGCGVLGSELLELLLKQGYPPAALGACCRNGEGRLAGFAARGVQCVTDCGRFAQWGGGREKAGFGCRVLVLAVPHAQLKEATTALTLARSRRGTSGLAFALTISCVAGVPYAKLRQLLPGCPHLVRTAIDLPALAAQGLGGPAGVASASTEEETVEEDEGHRRSLEAVAGTHLAAEGHAARVWTALDSLQVALGRSPDEAKRASFLSLIGGGAGEGAKGGKGGTLAGFHTAFRAALKSDSLRYLGQEGGTALDQEEDEAGQLVRLQMQCTLQLATPRALGSGEFGSPSGSGTSGSASGSH